MRTKATVAFILLGVVASACTPSGHQGEKLAYVAMAKVPPARVGEVKCVTLATWSTKEKNPSMRYRVKCTGRPGTMELLSVYSADRSSASVTRADGTGSAVRVHREGSVWVQG